MGGHDDDADRFDSDVHNALTQRIALHRFDTEAVVLPGGWSVPADQVPGFPFNNLDRLLTPTRGGMKYPTKGSSVTTKKLTPKQQLRLKESALDSNLTLQRTLKAEEEALRADIRKFDIPNPPPPRAGDMFRVAVQFGAGQTVYTYLLARSGDRWFTTGTREEHKVFESWDALCAWLNTTYWHSNVERLVVTGSISWPTEHTA